jgi:hypothetical protein
MPSQYNLYLDEAGNTGGDLVCSDQPFFTMAAVGIPVEKEAHFALFISELKKKYKFTHELKGKSLIGTKNEPLIEELMREIFNQQCPLFFTVLEKKYMVAGKIVENYFDPWYNSKTDNSWTAPSEKKKNLANYFYNNLSDSTMDLTAVAMQKGEHEKVANAFHQILHETNDAGIKSLLEGARPHLEELSESLRDLFGSSSASEMGSGKVMISPNYTMFFGLMHRIEDYSRNANIKLNMIFDSSRGFNESFSKLFAKYKTDREGSLNVFQTPIYLSLKHVESFDVHDSSKCESLQVADIISSSLNSLFHKIKINSNLWTVTQNERRWFLFIYALIYELPFGDLVVSDTMRIKFVRFLADVSKMASKEVF